MKVVPFEEVEGLLERIEALEESGKAKDLEIEQLQIDVAQTDIAHKADLGALASSRRIEVPKSKDMLTVQFRQDYGTCGVIGPNKSIWAAEPLRAASGEIVDMPKYLAMRINKDEPEVMFIKTSDFRPQLYRRKKFNQDTGKVDLVDGEVSVRELMKKKKQKGFPRVR